MTGRLKLREQEGLAPQLIAYERADQPGRRESRYRLVEVSDAAALKQALASALGVRVEVTKERRLFLWRSVRIHLDAVEALGHFIEFEAVAPPDSDLSPEREKVDFLRDAFAIAARDLVASSYSDLVAAARPRSP